MEDPGKMIDRLRSRLESLAAAYSKLSGMLERSESEREKLLLENRNLKQTVAELEHRLRVLELSKGLTEISGGPKAAREKVNRLINEIDQCIDLMYR